MNTPAQACQPIVLQPAQPMRRLSYTTDAGSMLLEDCQGGFLSLHMRRPNEDGGIFAKTGWYGSERLVDQQRREWSRQIGPLIQDDFGFLVEVPA